jgi:hypothetical protein
MAALPAGYGGAWSRPQPSSSPDATPPLSLACIRTQAPQCLKSTASDISGRRFGDGGLHLSASAPQDDSPFVLEIATVCIRFCLLQLHGFVFLTSEALYAKKPSSSLARKALQRMLFLRFGLFQNISVTPRTTQSLQKIRFFLVRICIGTSSSFTAQPELEGIYATGYFEGSCGYSLPTLHPGRHSSLCGPYKMLR